MFELPLSNLSVGCAYLRLKLGNTGPFSTAKRPEWIPFAVIPAPSLNSSLGAFDLDCGVVDDYSGHEF